MKHGLGVNQHLWWSAYMKFWHLQYQHPTKFNPATSWSFLGKSLLETKDDGPQIGNRWKKCCWHKILWKFESIIGIGVWCGWREYRKKISEVWREQKNPAPVTEPFVISRNPNMMGVWVCTTAALKTLMDQMEKNGFFCRMDHKRESWGKGEPFCVSLWNRDVDYSWIRNLACLFLEKQIRNVFNCVFTLVIMF